MLDLFVYKSPLKIDIGRYRQVRPVSISRVAFYYLSCESVGATASIPNALAIAFNPLANPAL